MDRYVGGFPFPVCFLPGPMAQRKVAEIQISLITVLFLQTDIPALFKSAGTDDIIVLFQNGREQDEKNGKDGDSMRFDAFFKLIF
jgi:hypothetical protein